MAPPKRPWFRFYVETPTDPKIRRLSPEERWLWVAVLAAARKSPMPGWLLLTESIPLDADDLGDFAGVTPAKVEKGLAKLVTLGLVITDPLTGAWRVARWDERQFESDDTTARTKKHRQNAKATAMERSIDGEATPPETDTESDTETKDDDASDSVGRNGSSSSGDSHRSVWLAYAELVADAQADPPAKRSAFLTSVARKAERERRHRLVEYLRVAPDTAADVLARWLYDDIDPVHIERPELDDDFTPASELRVIA